MQYQNCYNIAVRQTFWDNLNFHYIYGWLTLLKGLEINNEQSIFNILIFLITLFIITINNYLGC